MPARLHGRWHLYEALMRAPSATRIRVLWDEQIREALRDYVFVDQHHFDEDFEDAIFVLL